MRIKELSKAIHTICKHEGVALLIQRVEISDQIIDYLRGMTHQEYLDLREELITSCHS